MSTSWFPESFKRPNIALSNGDSHPLLPSNGGIPPGEDEEDDQEIELEMRRFGDEPRPKWMGMRRSRPPWFVLVAILAVFSLLALLVFQSSPSKPRGPIPDFWNISNTKVDALYARQSSSLEQAIARYSLRNNRPPPPMYERWYEFARGHSCLIDEYDQISRDFEPFYQLAQDDPTFFKRMVSKATPQVQADGRGMKTGVFADHKFSWTDDQGTLYTDDWPRTFGRFADFMPNMSVILNGRDEPRVVFNYRLPNMRTKALNVSDVEPFRHTPHPTALYFKDDGCLIPDRPTGFTGLTNDASAFMLYSSSTDFTTDLYPVMSMTKISPCFADILVPSEFYYTDSWWAPKYGYPNNITWEDKTPQLYWRGMTSGGHVFGQNYHAFPRFRLIDIGRKHLKLMNVKLSGFHDGLCGENCDAETIKKEYDIAHVSSPREEVYKYKYLFDVDGNSFSGRYLGLLRSGSLVFKSTAFAEYFNDWLRPFEHYIPILPDLSDLVEKLEWAVAHDAEAHEIQQAGQVFAERVLTDAQNDCYFSAVLLEWARLQGMADEIAPPKAPVNADEDEGGPPKALPVEVTPVLPEEEDNAND